MPTIDVLLQLQSHVQKDQEANEALRAENRKLRAALEATELARQEAVAEAEVAQEETVVLRSLLRRKDEEIRRQQEGRHQAEAERDYDKSRRHHAEAELLWRTEEMATLIEEVEADCQFRVEEADGRRVAAEEEARHATRMMRGMRKRLRKTEQERDQAREEVKIERNARQDTQDRLDNILEER